MKTCPDCYEIGVRRDLRSPGLVDLCAAHATPSDFHEGKPVVVVITLALDGNLDFSVPLSADHIVKSHEPFLFHQLELLAERLRQHRCPFGFLDSVDPHIKCDTCEKLVPKQEVHNNSHTIWTEDEMFAYPNTCGPVNQAEEKSANLKFHKCSECEYHSPCKSPKDDDCDCGIYCPRCDEARQETPA